MAATWLRDPRRLRATFVVVLGLLVAVLGALGWKLLDQDRELATARAAERRDGGATVLLATLERRLSGWQQRLGRVLADPTEAEALARDGVMVVSFHGASVKAWPAGALVYTPAATSLDGPDARALTLAAEGAQAVNGRDLDVALSSYHRLAALGAAQVAGLPAALAARIGRITLYERVGNHDAMVREADLLAADLSAGRWPIGPHAYYYLRSVADPLLPVSPSAVDDAECLAEIVTELWDEWTTRQGPMRPGWETRASAAGPFLVVWQVIDDRLAALIGPSRVVGTAMLADLREVAEEQGVQFAVSAGGRELFSTVTNDAPPVLRPASQTGLPWDLGVVSSAEDKLLTTKRRLLVTALGVLALLTLGGALVVGRSVTRELEAARLKSDFVAAVSHEFRTPLTTLCQLSELLLRERVASDEDRREYYALLHRESERLRRMVEGLLTFGRFDSGTADLRLEPTDLVPLLTEWTREFGRVVDLTRHPFRTAIDRPVPHVPADADALKSVFWNLFENAVKYSPDGGDIVVRLKGSATGVEVSVQDEGVGVPSAERDSVFEPFVRGADARARHIRGSGIGLAVARAIVRAHGGELTLKGGTGPGSTFVVRLPTGVGGGAHA